MKKLKKPENSNSISWKVLALFIGVGGLFTAQMIWWIIFFTRLAGETAGGKYTLMIITEGGFFLVLILAGLLLIFRVLKREIDLKNQFKDFFTGFSHELKTPIASLKLQAETMRSRELAKEQREHLLDNILTDIEQLELSLDNILDVFRYEAEAVALDLTPLEFDEWLRQVVDRMMYIHSHSGLEVDLRLSSGAIVKLDDRYMTSVISNLFQNSVRYADQSEPSVTIATSLSDDGTLHLQYEDNGMGIEPEEAETIFEKYYRSGRAHSLQHKGSGVGLFVVRQVVKLHGGGILAEGRGKGAGLRFLITLPAENDNGQE